LTSSAGSISTSFNGVDGFLVNLVVAVAQGTVRDTVSKALRSFISFNFNSTLDAVLSSLDVTTLAPTFAVPRVDGTTPLAVSFSTGFSSLSATTSRLLVMMGTRFQAPSAHTRPSLGAPLPAGTMPLDPSLSGQSLAAANHVGVFNQAMHALWRGGYFDAELSEGHVNGLIPAGVTLRTTAALPPVTTIRSDGRLDVALGAVQVHVEYPALLATPVDVGIGGRVSCDKRLVGNDITLDNCTVDELHVSTGAVLDPATGAQIEELLSAALNSIVSKAVNDGLPSLPIPGFKVPASLGPYGLPVGSVIGLVSPTMTTEGNYFVVRGGFGIR